MTLGLIAVGLVVTALAGVMAFLIAYHESLHHFSRKSEARRHALGTAFAAVAFFGVLAIVIAVVVPHAV
jgi:hypothetical protein